MAKQPQKPAPNAPAQIPADWKTMTREERIKWRKDHPGVTGQQAPVSQPTVPPPAPSSSPAPAPVMSGGYAPPDQEQPDYNEVAEDVADKIAHDLNPQNARCLVAKILHAVADALNAGVGPE